MEYIATGKVEDEFTEELESAVESLRADMNDISVEQVKEICKASH